MDGTKKQEQVLLNSEQQKQEVKRAYLLEVARLVCTVVMDIVCTVYVWNGQLKPGFATAAIITKDWISELAIETQSITASHLLSDLLRDLHCLSDVIVCVALSFYEAQLSIEPEISVGVSIKVAIAVGCAIHVPLWIFLMSLSSLCAGNPQDKNIFSKGEISLFLAFQIPAWALAVSVTGGANSIELAFVAVALNKVAIFTSKSPLDATPMKWAKGLFFSMATAVQVILMNSALDEPPNIDECTAQCPYPHCRIGTAIISANVPTTAQNGTRANNSWPDRLTLPTDRRSGWLILDKEGACAQELRLSGTQRELFQVWTILMSIGGVIVLAMIFYAGRSAGDADDGSRRQSGVQPDPLHRETPAKKDQPQHTSGNLSFELT